MIKRQLKILGYLSIASAVFIFATYCISVYFDKTILDNWDNISSEKNKVIGDECIDLFNIYQSQTSDFSSLLTKNKKLITAFSSQNTKKAYEYLFESNKINDYDVEVYNPRLELFLFSGRQLNPDILDLKRALGGEKFSAVKEIGYYSYLVVYEPIKSDSLNQPKKSGGFDGVLVTARLLDIKHEIESKFFGNEGITREIFNRYHTEVSFDFRNTPNRGIQPDTALLKDNNKYDIKNIRSEVIGSLYVPKIEKSSYRLTVKNKFLNFINIQVFILNILIIIMSVYVIKSAKSQWVKGIILAAVLISSRYLWLAIDFPGKMLTESGMDSFSPAYFASGFGFGIAKSIGDLFITSLFVVVISTYFVILVTEGYYREVKNRNKILSILITGFCAAGVILIIHFYGLILQSLIYDSTIKFVDRSEILSTDQLELVFVRLAILVLSVSVILLILGLGIIMGRYSFSFIPPGKFLRKNFVLIIFAFIILLNLLIELLPPDVFEFSLKLNLRILILAASGALTFYIYRKLSVTRNYRFVSLLNFSLIVLICTAAAPLILLSKITSQENKYLERVANDISRQSDDKINFLITSTLEDISDNQTLEQDLKDKNKYSKLAFNIWAQSKFYDEDLNSAVFVLDTAKKLISDFNFNPAELSTDSVINFSVQNLKKAQKKAAQDTLMSDDDSDNDLLSVSDMIDAGEPGAVQKNKEMKFFSGIKPVEKSDLKNSRFSRVIGYIVIAVQYDSKNYFSKTSMGIFKNSSRDNTINKLTSSPVISEFSDGELIGSSNREVSKAFIKSLDAFRESVKNSREKSALRYDEFENELYKSFYLVSSRGALPDKEPEKIFVVSVKVNDFGLTTFFIFRFLLFVVIIYSVFLVIFMLYKVSEYIMLPKKNRLFNFGFREKLFASFLVASVIPIIILAVYTREFVKEKNNDFYKNQIISDLRIVEQYVRNKISPEEPPALNKNPKQDAVINSSDIFGKSFSESDKNFNYFVKTKLAASTNEQLYKSDLLDTRISGSAYYNIVLLKKDYYSETQEIRNFKYIVGYIPMYDKFNNLTGIISTQTLFKQSEINQELTASLVYIFGPYFVAVIFLIVIVNILSYRISNPIIKLQKATEQLSRGNTDIQVQTTSKDEIGELVRSFNRMTRELKRSRAELKKVERESAWRDIARQVAHEIKNPLTPMKLAMQHLYSAYSQGSNDFKSILQTTNRLIIDQIETLNKIATEFSDFAKMPSRNYVPLNLDEILNDVVKLMNTEGTISLKLDDALHKHEIMGDKDEVKRAFINIIRNSMQAIDEKNTDRKGGLIKIESNRNNGFYSVKIKDNGSGMDEYTLQKLFEPYFSTKSSGMGLGLVITKKILDDMKAKISVKSELNKGTEVEIKFSMVEK